MRIRLFASLRDLAGSSMVEVDASTVGQVLDQLSERLGPQFDRIMRAGAVVVNGSTAEPGQRLQEGDEVALLPPVSGG